VTSGPPAEGTLPQSEDSAQDAPAFLEVLVEMALDDIEIGNLDVGDALRMTAIMAWREGRKGRSTGPDK
jgi:hypothetical protein